MDQALIESCHYLYRCHAELAAGHSVRMMKRPDMARLQADDVTEIERILEDADAVIAARQRTGAAHPWLVTFVERVRELRQAYPAALADALDVKARDAEARAEELRARATDAARDKAIVDEARTREVANLTAFRTKRGGAT
jgi:hypothetical protein